MGAASWAIPVGVLAAICGVGLIFVAIWFPRAWQKGVNDEARRVAEAAEGEDDEERAAARAENWARARAVVNRAIDDQRRRERGEAELTMADINPPEVQGTV